VDRGWRVDVVDDPSPADLLLLDERLDTALLNDHGHRDVGQIVVLVHDGQGQLIAGGSASTWGGCCELATLWVDESFRNNGLGSQVLEAVECEAERRGCAQIVVFTHSRRAPTLYLRRGFDGVGSLADYPQGSSAVWLRKRIAVG